LVQWLDKDYGKKPTAEKAFRILNYLNSQRKTPMNQQNTQTIDDGLDQVNAAVLKRFANNGTQIKHFQSADGDGWVPGRSGIDPVNTGSIADLLATVASSGSDIDVAAKLRALVLAL